MSEKTPPPSARSTVQRLAKRAEYDPAVVNRILDEGLICHVGFVDEGAPVVIPTIHARVGDRLVLHGSRQSRMLQRLMAGAPACVTVTLVDGLVLARSAFHHSMNYRSVVVFGTAREIADPVEKRTALAAFVEQLVPGRNPSIRATNDREMAATSVVAFPISEASAKIRTGGPVDDEDDYALPAWAGVLPVRLTYGPPEPDARLTPGIAVPDHVSTYRRPVS